MNQINSAISNASVVDLQNFTKPNTSVESLQGAFGIAPYSMTND